MRAAVRVSVLAVALAGSSLVAYAGSDLTGGYSFTRLGEENYHGWNAAFTLGVGERLGLTADLAGHYASFQDADFSLFSYMAGPRLTLVGGKTTVFLQALGGRVRASESITPFGNAFAGVSTTSTGVLVGAGVDLGLSERWGVRVTASYLGIDADPEWESQPRISVGLSYRLGAK